MSDGAHTVTAAGDKPVEKALHVPLSEERAAQSLNKTGGTPYLIKELNCHISSDAAASAAALNALRREALAQLGKEREICHHYTINEIDLSAFLTGGEITHTKKYAVTQIPDVPDSMRDMDMIFVDVFGLADLDKLKNRTENGFSIGAEVPRATFSNEAEIFDRLKKLKKLGVDHLTAHNIAAAYMGKALGFTVHAGFGMNIANSYTLKWAKEYGIADAVLSVELDEKRISRLYKSIPVGIVRYGYLPLMLTRNHPAGKNSCKNDEYLQDRKGESFLVRRREEYSEIYNCVPVLMPEKDYSFENEVFSVFLFSVENSVDNMEKTMAKIRKNLDFERKTHGLYIRGVKNLTIF